MVPTAQIQRIGFLITALAAAGIVTAYPRYNDETGGNNDCSSCHGAFTDGSSPKGTVFPSNNKHTMHRSNSYMNAECDLCHTSSDGRNPWIGSSDGTSNNPGLGCTGCHQEDGLRAHHAISGVTTCSLCHPSDPPPPGEDVLPVYYGTADTNVDDPCNAGPGFLENWSVGDTEGLDNDGDNLYDGADPDCAGGGCTDNDGDGYGDPGDPICTNGPETDCDDTDPNIFPGATEVLCNGIDENCNGLADDDQNVDGDPVTFCNGDCDDTDPNIFPGATEVLCNGIDENCNGLADDDQNVDGDPVTFCNGDCDDTDPNIFPGATEVLCNGIDENCNGLADDDQNVDGDPVTFCNGDCDDTDPNIFPGATEVLCNGIDENCNGLADDDQNVDGDPVTFCNGDCDDTDPNIFPGATEVLCNGIDENCNGLADDDQNVDGDPVTFCNGDCDDTDPTIFPGATEVLCNGIDENCNGLADDDQNIDGDPVTFCNGDCDDTDPTIFPGATEVLCNGIDENCNGLADDDQNIDGDPVTFCNGDCDDTDPNNFPGNPEVCDDGSDNDCDTLVDAADPECFAPATIVTAASLLDHGGTELPIDLTANNIEPRLNGVQKLEFIVDVPVASVTSSVSCVDSVYGGTTTTTAAGSTVTVELSEALAGQDCCEITLSGDAVDTFQVRTLAGDIDRNGIVSTGDASIIKPHFGETATVAGAEFDFDQNDIVSTGDASIVKPRFGNAPAMCP